MYLTTPKVVIFKKQEPCLTTETATTLLMEDTMDMLHHQFTEDITRLHIMEDTMKFLTEDIMVDTWSSTMSFITTLTMEDITEVVTTSLIMEVTTEDITEDIMEDIIELRATLAEFSWQSCEYVSVFPLRHLTLTPTKTELCTNKCW